jgi:hypothetical protein
MTKSTKQRNNLDSCGAIWDLPFYCSLIVASRVYLTLVAGLQTLFPGLTNLSRADAML